MGTTATERAPAPLVEPVRGGRRDPKKMGRGISFPRVAGIEITLDWSVVLVFLLIVFSLAGGLLPTLHPEWTAQATWALACVAAAIFIASVLAHELAHALVGRRYGVEVHGITLFVFGGVARLKSDPKSARAEFMMAVAGPLTSLAIGVVATAAGWALAYRESPGSYPEAALKAAGPLATLLLWLGPLNLLLVAFNLLPGFPLDGGRVLRAALWRATGDMVKATRWAAGAGRALGMILMLVGFWMLFGARVPLLGGGVIQGLWLLLIGWFLTSAAVRSYQQVLVSEALKGVVVARVMRRPVTAPADAPIEEIAERFLVAADQRCLPVADGDRFVGLVCLPDLRRVPRQEWPRRPVREVVTPVEALETVRPEDEMIDALRKLVGRDVDQLPVMTADGRLEGIVRRADVLRWVEMNAPTAELEA